MVDLIGVGATVPIRVRNLSHKTWPSVRPHEEGLVGLRFRTFVDGTPRTLSGFIRLPADLAPGEEAVVWAGLWGNLSNAWLICAMKGPWERRARSPR